MPWVDFSLLESLDTRTELSDLIPETIWVAEEVNKYLPLPSHLMWMMFDNLQIVEFAKECLLHIELTKEWVEWFNGHYHLSLGLTSQLTKFNEMEIRKVWWTLYLSLLTMSLCHFFNKSRYLRINLFHIIKCLHQRLSTDTYKSDEKSPEEKLAWITLIR